MHAPCSPKNVDRFCPTSDIVHRLAMIACLSPNEAPGAISELAVATSLDLDRLQADLPTVRRALALKNSSEEAATFATVILEQQFAFGCTLWLDPDGTFWEFSDGYWQEVPKGRVRQAVQDALLENPNLATAATKETLSDVVSLIETVTLRKSALLNLVDTTNLPTYVAKNGEIWLHADEIELRPHRPWSRQTMVSEVAYDPEATSPLFDKTVAAIFSKAADPAGMVRHFLEFFGYAISPDRRLPAFILLFGHGANGKTTLLDLLQRLIGPEAVLSESLERFQKDNFAMSSLIGKRLLVDEDVSQDLVDSVRQGGVI